MQGELYFRSRVTRQLTAGATGLITTIPSGWNDSSSSGYDSVGWVDAYLRYGMSLEDGAISKLLTPAPMKTPTNSSNALRDGVAFSGPSIGKTDLHDFSFDMHIVAADKNTFQQLYKRFCDEILRDQYFQLRISIEPTKVRHLLYEGCEPFSVYNLEMAKFTLAVKEPHPEINDNRVPPIMSAT